MDAADRHACVRGFDNDRDPPGPQLVDKQIGDVLGHAFLDLRTMRYDFHHAGQLAQAHEFILRQEKGYATIVGERGAALSGGQRQRIGLARALLPRPRLLILDEATSALEDELEERIYARVLDEDRDRTVIMITHRHEQLRYYDQIVTLSSEGRVAHIDRSEPLARGQHST